MNKIPTEEECIQYLQEAGCSEEVICHCKAVRDVAVRIAEKAHADIKLVEAGALLHDIGRSKTHGIQHAIEGVKIAEQLGLPIQIVFIIKRHIGAGINKDEAIRLGLPEDDYIPETLEEKIVCHADSMIAHCSKQPIEHEISYAISEGLIDYAQRLREMHTELSDICKIDVDLL
jgi:uncharacterized protein (TIGR00295 family)